MSDYSHTIDANNRAVILIGDFHAPYHHVDYLSFIKAIHKKYKSQKPIIINMGDEVDYHSISFHDSDEELFSAGHELELAKEELSRWHEAFPEKILLNSNHGSLVFRRLKHHGIPLTVLKPLQELYDTPKWQWYDDILLKTKSGDVYLCHGKASGNGALAKEMGCSAVQGHYHGRMEVTWHHRIGHKRFNMFVGCGINWKSLAFAYGKNHIPKPILGCGVIDKNGIPRVYPMLLNEKQRWIKKT